jgi:hypothetical protein
MTLAACTIVSSRSNDGLDAYVLSESSLFVYPNKFVLKTCGTTKLLNSVPRLLELAGELGLAPRRCKYSRASFLFPDQQVSPGGGVGVAGRGAQGRCCRGRVLQGHEPCSCQEGAAAGGVATGFHRAGDRRHRAPHRRRLPLPGRRMAALQLRRPAGPGTPAAAC